MCLLAPAGSTDDTSCDESGQQSETDFESALSVDDDQETVVAVNTRETTQQTALLLVPKTSRSADQVSRARGALDLMQATASTSAQSRVTSGPDAVKAKSAQWPPVPADHPECTFCVGLAAANLAQECPGRSVSQTDVRGAIEVAPAMCVREEKQRVSTEHRRKSRHTKAGVAPVLPSASAHNEMRQTAASDQD